MKLRRPRRAGFSLVEVMVLVLILSVLAMAAVPTLQRIQRRAKTTAVVGDFRTFAAAFDSYAHEMGGWPGEVAAGAIPPGMSQRLQTTAWLRRTPMGGKYNWDYRVNHFGTVITAAISIGSAVGVPYTLDVPQLTDLERTIDKGTFNWLGGNHRLGSGLVPVFVVQP